MNLTPNTRRAMKAYGAAACLEAFRMHEVDGHGASSVALQGPSTICTTNQADAAINAGRELHAADFIPDCAWIGSDGAAADAFAKADKFGMPMTTVRTPGSHGWMVVNFGASVVRQQRHTMLGFTALPSAFFTPAWRGEA